jgi:hypothetical protein
MIRMTGRLAAAALALLIAASGAALAADKWQKVHAPADGFEAMFPGNATFASQDVKGNGGVQHTWVFNPNDAESYQIGAITYPAGSLPAKPDQAFYAKLTKAYAGGAECKVSDEGSVTIEGHPGYEAVCDNSSGKDTHHLLDILVIGQRLYMIVSAGPGKHPTGAAAQRFANSFKLIER